MTTAAAEKHGFQAEVRELLHLMIHSLYSHKEIFLRELISNASDANDKLRFLALSDGALYGDDPELKIWISCDKDQGTVTIRDNGIGMTRDDAVSHLGTIARSGTSEFFKQLTGDQQKDSALIGQFGVGFYSAFIVAAEVEVLTRRAGAPTAEGVRWASKADGEFTVEHIERPERGTTVVLHLKEDTREFCDAWKLRSLVRRYSDHLAFPVLMPKDVASKEIAGKDGAAAGVEPLDWEPVNEAKALWTRPRTEIKDEEYREFYQHVTHDFAEPLAWSHNKVEGKREYTSLLYIPARAPFDLYHRDAARGLKLYVRRVFIMDDAEQFLPLYLRFVKGVLDSSDLPLNISRELLQQDADVEAMRGALTKRALDLLAKLMREDTEKYATFWKEFGAVLKEGVGEDAGNRDKIMPLLRFATTHAESNEPAVSLGDYLARMKQGQQFIYFVTADSMATARSNPCIEQLRAKGVEVLLLGDRIDEWVMSQVREFEGKRFKDAARGDLELGTLGGADAKADADAKAKAETPEGKAILERMKTALGERVAEVRASTRLIESPACLVIGEHDMGEQMRRIFEASGQKAPESKPALEVNLEHALVKRLASLSDDAEFTELAQLLADQAQLAEGGRLANPGEFVQRLNRVLGRFVAARAAP